MVSLHFHKHYKRIFKAHNWLNDDMEPQMSLEQIFYLEYRNNMGVKQYKLGDGDLNEIFQLIDKADNRMFNYSVPENSKDMAKALITNINSNILLKNQVLQDEADAYITQKEVRALQLEVMKFKKEVAKLKQH
ncbi:hypothetical protein HMPREF1451_00217 [Helicobacter pylori HP260BFii]|uniref:Uncharacterized protein n=3 Tax=Helicobacter pylori TaxID=210 RepID=M3Q177_HELPX|nr:hypothetical protein HMPREF1418_00293 [Helicobacter pylori GAM260BSi]EMH69795.1 hypothetical protein HMPREF1451_00217 [Helicobacter pylori HP260BFii]